MNKAAGGASSWKLGFFFLAVFAVALKPTLDLPERAQPFPLFVLTVGLLLVVCEMGLALLRPMGDEDSSGLDLRADDEHDLRSALRAAFPIFSWIAALLVATWLMGPTIVVPAWLAAYMLAFAGVPLLRTLVTVGAFAAATIFLFDFLLQIPWPSGAISGVQEWAQRSLMGFGI